MMDQKKQVADSQWREFENWENYFPASLAS